MSPTILIADDDPVIQKLLAVNFEMEGYRVVTASDGAEALERVGSDHPDLAVLDVMMPKVDGLDVVRTLRADSTTCTMPIILLSAKAQAVDINRGLEAGADAYVTKPFDPAELLDKAAALIRTAEGRT